MNQRMLELLLEAGFAAPEIAGRARTLANLIVEECAKICERNDPKPDQWSEMYEFTESRVVKKCATDIRGTFKDE